ncbi:family 43 glycosylhydrolase [Paradesertivirga mongoliensis]|uniref:Family 43 glycosylhydrolase n=1 Tax=Paradesertivirga mongoliensis TaxID=2100740 RepID=A0ABW4ZLV2_9SPHI|nr:family 43 glycosylhydrolase [Pedobacter mongoliensis]
MKTNNPIIRHVFTSDPTLIEHDGVVYLYTGHDECPVEREEYIMTNWLCFSSRDLVNWVEHPSPLAAKDYTWASGDAFASKIIYYNNLFYFFTAVSHKTIPGKAIGIAVSERPTGPFFDAKGAALITGDMLPVEAGEKANLDPSVIIDDDGRAFIFWGNGRCLYSQLSEDLLELKGEIKQISLPEFNEGSHVYKRNGNYYLMYGYGTPERVAYAMSESIYGPWKFMGLVNELAGNCETNRPATLDISEKSYFFYHNGGLKDGGSHRRSVCMDYLHYNNDGTIKKVMMTSEGIEPVSI